MTARSVGAATAGDSYLPGHGNGGYRVDRYDLDLEYRVATNRLRGTATIHAHSTQPLERFSLDLARLRVSRVRIEGRRRAVHPDRRASSSSRRRTALPADTDFIVVIDYAGAPAPVRSRWGAVGWEELNDGVLVAAQPSGASTWFPAQRPGRRQGEPTASGSRTDQAYTVVAQRHPRRPPRRIRPGALALRAGRADRELPRHRPDRSLPATRHRLGRSPGRDRVPACRSRSGDGRPRCRRRHDGALPGAIRPVSLRELHGRRDRRTRSRSPSRPRGSRSSARTTSTDTASPSGSSRTSSPISGSATASVWRAWKDIWLNEGFACYAEWIWSEHSGGMSAAGWAQQFRRQLSTQPRDIVVGDPGPALDVRRSRLQARRPDPARPAHRHRRCGVLRAAPRLDRPASLRHGDDRRLPGLAGEIGGQPLDRLFQSWLFETPLPRLP